MHISGYTEHASTISCYCVLFNSKVMVSIWYSVLVG